MSKASMPADEKHRSSLTQPRPELLACLARFLVDLVVKRVPSISYDESPAHHHAFNRGRGHSEREMPREILGHKRSRSPIAKHDQVSHRTGTQRAQITAESFGSESMIVRQHAQPIIGAESLGARASGPHTLICHVLLRAGRPRSQGIAAFEKREARFVKHIGSDAIGA